MALIKLTIKAHVAWWVLSFVRVAGCINRFTGYPSEATATAVAMKGVTVKAEP